MKARFYHGLSHEQLLEKWRELNQQHRPTVLFHNAFTPALAHFRWYDDDNTEAASTSLANEDATYDVDVSGGDVQLQLRIGLDETGNDTGANNVITQLQYDPAGGTAWANVTAATSAIQGTPDASTPLTADGATTNRATNGITDASTFYAGRQITDDGNDDGTFDYLAAQMCEHVFAITVIAADVADNDTITFRVTIAGTGVTNSVTPTLTITKTSGPVENNESQTDGMFLKEPGTQKDLLGLKYNDLYVDQAFQSNQLLSFAGDHLGLDESSSKQIDRIRQDFLLLDEDTRKQLALELTFALLLKDSGSAQKVISQVITDQSSTDGLFLRPNGTLEFHHWLDTDDLLTLSLSLVGPFRQTQVIDALLLASLRLSDRSAIATDHLLVDYSVAITKLKDILASDELFLYDSRVSELLKQALDALLVGDAVSAQKFGAAVLNTVVQTDELLLLDTEIAEQLKTLLDTILVAQSGGASQLHYVTGDAALLGTADAESKERNRATTDKLVFSEEKFFEQLKVILDQPLIDSYKLFELFKTVPDSILLASLASTSSSREIFEVDTDGVFVSDEAFRSTFKSFVFGLLLTNPWTAAADYNIAGDTLLLSSTAAPTREKIAAIADQLLLDDARLSEHDRAFLDGLLTVDLITKFVEYVRLDSVLLGSAVDAQKTQGAGVTTIDTTDGLFLLSQRVSLLEKNVLDGLLAFDTRYSLTELFGQADILLRDDTTKIGEFFPDQDPALISDLTLKVLELVRLEDLLLDSAVLTERTGAGNVFTQTEADGLLLLSRSLKTLEPVILEGLFINDQTLSTRELNLLDRLILTDYRVSEILKLHQDAIFVYDDRVAEILKNLRDGVLLDSIESQQRLRTHVATDGVLMLAQTVKERLMLLQDNAFLESRTQLIRDLLIQQGIFLYDSVSAVFIEAAAEALVFAELGIVDLLGGRFGFVDDFLLLRTFADENYLGVSTSWVRQHDESLDLLDVL